MNQTLPFKNDSGLIVNLYYIIELMFFVDAVALLTLAVEILKCVAVCLILA